MEGVIGPITNRLADCEKRLLLLEELAGPALAKLKADKQAEIEALQGKATVADPKDNKSKKAS